MIEEDIKKVIKLDEVPASLQLDLVKQYIKDLKGQTIEINHPDDAMRIYLLNIAFEVSKGYYKRKYGD